MSNSPPTASAIGEPRRDPVGLITILGFATLVLTATVAANLLLPPSTSTTQPSGDPTPASIVIGYATSLATFAVLTICDASLCPGMLRRIGFRWPGALSGLAVGAAAALVIVPAVFGASFLTEWFWQAIHLDHPSAHPLLRLFGESPPAQRWAITILAVIVAPVGEEMLFRAHLQQALTNATRLPPRGRFIFGVGLSSLLFTLFHGELWMMPPLLVLSIGMGTVFALTRNIFASIAVHVCFNATSVLYFWYSQ